MFSSLFTLTFTLPARYLTLSNDLLSVLVRLPSLILAKALVADSLLDGGSLLEEVEGLGDAGEAASADVLLLADAVAPGGFLLDVVVELLLEFDLEMALLAVERVLYSEIELLLL